MDFSYDTLSDREKELVKATIIEDRIATIGMMAAGLFKEHPELSIVLADQISGILTLIASDILDEHPEVEPQLLDDDTDKHIQN